MVKKAKKSRSSASEKFNKRSQVESKEKKNPFDFHVNRLKHDALGKRRNYERGGQPLKARARGIEKRKQTLLKEFNSVFKRSSFIDNRIGEKDPTLSNEEKLMQRLIAERSKVRLGKESRYNLNDEEDLTHYGQSLSKSDELNRKPVMDDFDDEDQRKLNSDHFFGGFQSSEEKRRPQSKKEWIEEMIKTTKLDKYERQRENEKVFDMTENLDEQWKALSLLMGIKDRKAKSEKETPDDFDKLVHSLRFEATTPGVPVKTIEQREKEDAERLKKLEKEQAERMQRPTMNSIVSKRRQQTHRSVEELDDSYYVMDGSKRRVQFNEEIATEETEVPDFQTEVEEEEEEAEENEKNDLTGEYEEIPSTLEKLEEKIRDDPSALMKINKRIHDKRLPAIPRSVLSIYFSVLLDYFQSKSEKQKMLNETGKRILQVLQIVNNDQTRSDVVSRLKSIQEKINERIENEKFFELDRSTIFFLKLIGHLYPTSDFRHPITTPAATILAEIVQHGSLSTLNSIRQILLIVDLIKQWNSKNQRYVPEVMLFFVKILQMINPSDKSRRFVLCSSKQIQKSDLLILKDDVQLSTPVVLNFFDVDPLDDNNQRDRALIVELTLNYLMDFLTVYQNLSAIREITKPIEQLLSSLRETCPSTMISNHCEKIVDFIQSSCQVERKRLEQGKQRKNPIQLFEPRFGPVYEGKKTNRLSQQYNENRRLQKKYKRDLKATAGELKRDSQFVAQEQLRQQMEKDTQRKRKVKEIQAQLSMQEGEYRKMKKML